MSRRIVFLQVLPLVLSAFAIAGPAPNRLTAKEKKEGWRLLFDGKTIDQWRGYQKKDMTGLRWVSHEGCLELPPKDGKDTKGAGDIVSTSEFDSFELAFDWRVSSAGNSGVKYLVSEDGAAAIGQDRK